MTATTSPGARARSFPRVVALLAGFFLLLFGVWAMAAPRSFFDTVALFEPYNQHFLQDIGAFQIGLGAVLLLGVAAPANGLGVALLGVGVGAAAHTVSHIIGRDLGGKPLSDIPALALLTALLLAAGWRQWRDGRACGAVPRAPARNITIA